MKTYSEVSGQNQKPDKKCSDLVGQTIEIVDLETKTLTVRGKEMTFNTLVLADGSRIGANPTIAKQVQEKISELPFAAKIGQRRAKLGNYQYLE